MKVLVTGGTGFIGRSLAEELSQTHAVTVISRTKRENQNNIKYILWDSKELMQAINETDIIINLAGEPIANKRWTEEQKEILRKSRIETTRLIVSAINNSIKKPKKLISASAIGIYGNRGDEILTEKSSLGNDFLANLCKEWESEANNAKVNVTILRIGIVIGEGGGALEKMLLPFKLFLGGPLGSGNQWMSWIALEDIIGIIKFAIENENATGILNAVSPNPVTNKEFSKTLGQILHRPSFIPTPEFALKIILGEMAGVLVGGQKAVPEAIVEQGYRFEFANLEGILKKHLLQCTRI